MLIQSLKHRTQEAVDHHATRGNDSDNAHTGLGRDSAERIHPRRGFFRDLSSRALYITGIQNVDRNVLLNGWQQCRRMQYLRAKVSEFGGFIEADLLNRPRIRAQTRI